MQQYESFRNVFQSENIHVPYCKFKHFREITKPIQPFDKKTSYKKGRVFRNNFIQKLG